MYKRNLLPSMDLIHSIFLGYFSIKTTFMQQPAFLEVGDQVAIVSTARKISQEELSPAIQVIENWGLKVVFSEALFEVFHQFAGTEKQRLANLQHWLDDKNVKAIICARGGYGTVQIVDRLDFSFFKKHPKWIAGYSDVTTLHTHIHQHVKVETIHGTMPINFPKDGTDNESTLSLKAALFGELSTYSFKSHPLNIKGEASGELIGGNLSILYSLSGTNSAVDMRGKLLFMEDLDEYIYHIDRMMMNLRKSDWLKGVQGIIIGGMSDMNDNAVSYGQTAEEIIRQRTEDLGIPVAFNFPAGHIEPNKAIYFGRKCHLLVSESGSKLSF